ncbi:hypothetical protein A2U01_0112622, partial [Trifolium medium]|nr:hypothetical protein [Trifolium medium]
ESAEGVPRAAGYRVVEVLGWRAPYKDKVGRFQARSPCLG